MRIGKVLFINFFLHCIFSVTSIGFCNPNEFLVNTYTNNNQQNPEIAMDSAGNFVIAWESYGQDGSGYGIFAQLYNKDGIPHGNEFQVNTTTEGDQTNQQIVMDYSGNFSISWSFDGNTYGQKYDKYGNAQDSEYVISPFSVIAWNVFEWEEWDGIYAQRLGLDDDPFLVSNVGEYFVFEPSVGMDSACNFIIAWADWYTIYAKRFDKDRNPLGPEIQVSFPFYNYWYDIIYSSTIYLLNIKGIYLITWDSVYWDDQNNNYDGVFAQVINNSGNPINSNFVFDYIWDFLYYPLGMDSNDNFVITYSSEGDVFGQKYDKMGYEVGSEFSVNTYTESNQYDPVIASDCYGSFIIVWVSDEQDGSGSGVYAKLYKVAEENAIILERFTAHSKGSKVILEWKTGTEIDNLGFYIVKSEGLNKKRSLVYKSIIPAQGTSYSGHSYQYVDSNVDAGHVYYYWLVDVDVYGKYEIHGPVKVITQLESFHLRK